MAFSDGDIIRAVAKMSNDGDDVQNVYHLRVNEAGTADDTDLLNTIAGKFDTAYDIWDGSIHEDVTFDSVAVWNVTTDQFIGERPWVTLTSGGASSDALAPQLAPLVLFNTNVNRSQGRKFLPVVSETASEGDGTPTAVLLGALADYALEFLGTTLGVNDLELVFGNWNEAKDRFVSWVYATVPDFFATQRRRYTGRGS